MSHPLVQTRKVISRRQLLRGSGAAAIGLPMLEAMSPMLSATAATPPVAPKRLVAVCAGLGFHGPHLFPDRSGRDFQLTPYLQRLRNHRNDLTVFSGLSHPEQQGNNGHASEMTWLTSARRPGLAGFKNTISLDQMIARGIGGQTRFPYLALSTSGRSLSWTSNGVPIPGEQSAVGLFKKLFVSGTENQIKNEMRDLRRGRSILDTVRNQARSLQQQLGRRDLEKLDEYFSAVRDLENNLKTSQAWATQRKPSIDADQPKTDFEKTDPIGQQRALYDLIVLALETDSTRTVTFSLGGLNAVPEIPGVSSDWHNLSHHGKDPAKISELKVIEEAEFETFGEFLTKLKSSSDADANLLDQTAVLFGSNLGNASSHDWRNLPVILAGGGYRHGQHLRHDAKNNTPFANLFVSLAQRMGIEIDQFGSSTAAGIHGLEI
tara:strand:- start:225974 stop:227275 length:1302 start_codon:yes stop_codon:yes gene_type:complete